MDFTLIEVAYSLGLELIRLRHLYERNYVVYDHPDNGVGATLFLDVPEEIGDSFGRIVHDLARLRPLASLAVTEAESAVRRQHERLRGTWSSETRLRIVEALEKAADTQEYPDPRIDFHAISSGEIAAETWGEYQSAVEGLGNALPLTLREFFCLGREVGRVLFRIVPDFDPVVGVWKTERSEHIQSVFALTVRESFEVVGHLTEAFRVISEVRHWQGKPFDFVYHFDAKVRQILRELCQQQTSASSGSQVTSVAHPEDTRGSETDGDQPVSLEDQSAEPIDKVGPTLGVGVTTPATPLEHPAISDGSQSISLEVPSAEVVEKVGPALGEAVPNPTIPLGLPSQSVPPDNNRVPIIPGIEQQSPEVYAAIVRLMNVISNGVAEDVILQAAQMLADEKLSAEEKLLKLSVHPLNPLKELNGPKIGYLLGVGKQAIYQTKWWDKNRKQKESPDSEQ